MDEQENLVDEHENLEDEQIDTLKNVLAQSNKIKIRVEKHKTQFS